LLRLNSTYRLSYTPRDALLQSPSRVYTGLFRRVVTTEDPLDAVFVIKLAVDPKRHVVQFLQPFTIVAVAELVEYHFQLAISTALNEYGVRIALHRIKLGRSHPIGRGYFDDTALKVRVDDPSVLLWREHSFHRRVAELSQRQLAAQALVIERHRVSTVAVE